jgi:RimJ/RimL family protein N-acetyltransferase
MTFRQGSIEINDLELLKIEMDLLWGTDSGPELVLAAAAAGMCARVTRAVPEWLAPEVAGELESALPSPHPNVPPPIVERLRPRLEDALGTTIVLAPGSGPSFLIHERANFPATAHLVRSEDPDVSALRDANPGNWQGEEWRHLVAGQLGPWVMAVVHDQVVSICHTPVSNPRAAEAGVWTHPDYRGQGLAPACTAEWAALMRPSGRRLFYSTSHTNRSSQRVAARLGLRHLGYLWQLSRARVVTG